uniref:Uncharacterized protein n=1 Tax=Lotharella globosa TaxID=91324 RepID=A0A7S4DY20_9EUKA|mmetsp:Transcript_22591/g.44020  ORF Transcript_22591/g.44020 Transcript_22591/m.44020 type:complete len:629 (-) Transcript_22591:221-2107(-)
MSDSKTPLVDPTAPAVDYSKLNVHHDRVEVTQPPKPTGPTDEERALESFSMDEHYLERFGLFVVLVLGESISGITVNAVGRENAKILYLDVALGFLIALSVKMIYFDTEVYSLEDHAINRNKYTSALFDMAHTPIVLGIALFGSGLELLLDSSLEDVGREEEDKARWYTCLSLGLVVLSLALIQILHKPPQLVCDLLRGKKHYAPSGFDMEYIAKRFTIHEEKKRDGDDGHEEEEEEEGEEEPWYEKGLCQPVRLNTSKVRKATWTELFYDLVYVTVVERLGENLRGEEDEDSKLSLSDYSLYIITIWVFWKTSNEYATFYMNDDLYHKLGFALYMLFLVTVGMHVEGGVDGDNGSSMALSFMALRLIMCYANMRVAASYYSIREQWPHSFWMSLTVALLLMVDICLYLLAYFHSSNRRTIFWIVAIYNHFCAEKALLALQELVCFMKNDSSHEEHDNHGGGGGGEHGQGEGARAKDDDHHHPNAQVMKQMHCLREKQLMWNRVVWVIQFFFMASMGGYITWYLGYTTSQQISNVALLGMLMGLMFFNMMLNLVDEMIDSVYNAKVCDLVPSEPVEKESIVHPIETVEENIKVLQKMQRHVTKRLKDWQDKHAMLQSSVSPRKLAEKT